MAAGTALSPTAARQSNTQTLIDALVDSLRRHVGCVRLQVYEYRLRPDSPEEDVMFFIGEGRSGEPVANLWKLDTSPMPLSLAQRVVARYAELVTPKVQDAARHELNALSARSR